MPGKSGIVTWGTYELRAKVTVGTDRTMQASCCNGHALTPGHLELQIEINLLVPQGSSKQSDPLILGTCVSYVGSRRTPSSIIQGSSLTKLWLERNSIRWCLIQSIDVLMFNRQVQKTQLANPFFLQNGISSHWKYRNLQTHQQKIATSDGFRDLWLRLLRDSGGGTVSGNSLCQMDDGGSVSLLFGWSFVILFLIKKNMKPTFDSWSKSGFEKKVGTPTT